MCSATTGEVTPLAAMLTIASQPYQEELHLWHTSLDVLGYPLGMRRVVLLNEPDPPQGYYMASWSLAVERRLQEIVGYITSYRDQRVIVSDASIRFLPAFLEAQHRWFQTMESGGLDMLFIRERNQLLPGLCEGEVSVNLIVLRCTERCSRFWTRALHNQRSEPRMTGHRPFDVQQHINYLLTNRAGGDVQDGTFGIRWDFVPESDILWGEHETERDLALFAIGLPLPLLAESKSSTAQLGSDGEAVPQSVVEAEAAHLASELARLRREISNSCPTFLEQNRSTLALATAGLAVEVEKLVQTLQESSSAAPATPPVFEAVD